MQIYLGHAGERLGPFDFETVRAGLRNGTYSSADLAWYEGAPNWMPLSQVPGLIETPPTPPLPAAASAIPPVIPESTMPSNPLPTAAVAPTARPATAAHVVPVHKSRTGLYIGLGCGALTLLAFLVIGGCALLVKLGASDAAKSASSANANIPLRDRFPKTVGDGSFNAVYLQSSDDEDMQTAIAASACHTANYEVRALSIVVPVQLMVCQFPDGNAASAALQKQATTDKVALTTKEKGGKTVGKRYTGDDGRLILWTDGPLLCQVRASTGASATNFEKSLPY